jgi:hypothetical protein
VTTPDSLGHGHHVGGEDEEEGDDAEEAEDVEADEDGSGGRAGRKGLRASLPMAMSLGQVWDKPQERYR